MSNEYQDFDPAENGRDPNAPLPFDDVQAIIQLAYHELWDHLFEDFEGQPAEIQVLDEEGQDDFSPQLNLMRFRFDAGDRMPGVFQDFDEGTLTSLKFLCQGL